MSINRTTGILFAVTGVSTLGLCALIETVFSDAAYYDAQNSVDYATVLSVTSVLVLTGIALILLWRDPPVKRGSVFVLLAGIGAIAEGTGNLLEDVFNIESGVVAFFVGGIVMMVSLIIAGIAALTVNSPKRWSGLFLLLAVPGALLGFGALMMGIAWLLFGLWIVYQHRAFVVAIAVLWVPLVAAGLQPASPSRRRSSSTCSTKGGSEHAHKTLEHCGLAGDYSTSCALQAAGICADMSGSCAQKTALRFRRSDSWTISARRSETV